MEIFHGMTIGFDDVKPQDFIYVFEEFDKMGEIIHDMEDDAEKENSDNSNASTTELAATILALNQNKTSDKRDNWLKVSKDKQPPLSLGDILNVMDGLLENNGIITFLTANRIDHLHKAIIRPKN